MNRNTESHFSMMPSASIGRSKMNRDCTVKTSFNVGSIIPFYLDEVLPGDTFKVKTSKVIRMQPMVSAPMDNLYLDTYYFFVPNRLVWSHWKEFNGENTQSAWLPTTTYTIPQITAPSGGWTQGTLADYMGLPIGVDDISVNALPFRAYALICNEWFRDQNLMQPLNIPVGDATVAGSNGSTYVSDVAKGGIPYPAARYHDYFSSCLPAPQKGPDVSIPIAAAEDIPVTTMDQFVPARGDIPLRGALLDSSGTMLSDTNPYGLGLTGRNPTRGRSVQAMSGGTTLAYYFVPHNLFARFSGSAVAASINQLRFAFQLQKLYERDARGGSRYTEIIRSHFGVVSPDARLQRPEYLGGNRIPITITQVLQQSETATTPQGNVSGVSLTSDVHYDFTKSFTEHGYIIGVLVARQEHTYQQGIERMWSRQTRFDYYWPVFANIGEQAVKNKEIYAQGSSAVNPSSSVPYDDEVFGYQEAWSEYRYKPNHVTGQMRSAATGTLDSWHFADNYSSMPYLSDSWMRESPENVDRVMVVSHSVSDQLFADIYNAVECTRPMPVYSIPGLIDHH